MNFSIEEDIISVPDKPRRDKRKRSFEDLLELDDKKLMAQAEGKIIDEEEDKEV